MRFGKGTIFILSACLAFAAPAIPVASAHHHTATKPATTQAAQRTSARSAVRTTTVVQPKASGVTIAPHMVLPSVPPSYPGATRVQPPVASSQAYAFHDDFGKSNLRKWSSTEGMDTPWEDNDTTDTAHLQSGTKAFLDTLNTAARAAGISFTITGGAEDGYHASGRYSHANGYKVDISDDGICEGGRAYSVLVNALAPYKHQITHEWNLNHFDITIFPQDYDE